MKKLIEKIKPLLSSLKTTGFFSVFLAGSLTKVLSFIGGMIIVRVLTKAEHGEYTYVLNCYGMITILADLGCNSAALQCCNEVYKDPKKRDGYFLYGYSRGMLFSLITCILIAISPLFYPFQSPQTAEMTAWLCLLPLVKTTYSFAAVNLRMRMENGLYAKMNIFFSVITYLIILPVAYFFGVKGAVLSEYVINLIALGFVCLISGRHLKLEKGIGLINRSERSSFLKLAIATQLNKGVDSALNMLDIFLIGIFIANNEVISAYKVASTIPVALAFIPAYLSIYIVPHFVRHREDIGWVKKNYFRLMFFNGLLNLAITLGLIAMSGFIIPLIFGSRYAESVPCFCILMIGYFFSATFRVLSADIIYTQRKVKVNIIITFLSGIANCILDIVFIMNMGSIGAAVATTLVHVISSAMSFGYMCVHLKKSEKQLQTSNNNK